jgi:hypothetical protein
MRGDAMEQAGMWWRRDGHGGPPRRYEGTRFTRAPDFAMALLAVTALLAILAIALRLFLR